MADYEVTGNYAFKDRNWDNIVFKSGVDTAEAAVLACGPFYDQILDLMSPYAELVSISAANLNRQGRDAFKKFYSVGNGQAGGDDANPDITDTSALFTLYGSSGATRKLTISGLRDEDVKRNASGHITPSGSFTTRKNAFLAFLTTAGLSIRQIDLPAATGAGAWRPVRLMAPDSEDNDAYTKFTTIGDHGYAEGDIVHFKKPGDNSLLRGLSGDHRILEKTNNTFVLNTRYWPRPATYVPNETWVRKVTWALTLITKGTFNGFDSRQRGSSNEQRGRATGVSFRH